MEWGLEVGRGNGIGGWGGGGRIGGVVREGGVGVVRDERRNW